MFHDRAAATGNARSPRLDHLIASTNRVDIEPDRRRRHASVSDSGAVSRRVTVGHYHVCRK